MERYKNLAGDSPIVAYKILGDAIIVKFHDRPPYRYSYASAGLENVERMKRLARAGRGLATFISRTVKDRYDKG